MQKNAQILGRNSPGTSESDMSLPLRSQNRMSNTSFPDQEDFNSRMLGLDKYCRKINTKVDRFLQENEGTAAIVAGFKSEDVLMIGKLKRSLERNLQAFSQ